MENERPIEKLLRRCAHKRAEEAGSAFELHPANRRLLQGEVARQYPAKPTAEIKTVLLGRRSLWPRLAWALPVLLVLTVGVWLVFEQRKLQPGHAELAKAEYQSPVPSRAQPAIHSEAAEPEPQAARIVTTPDSAKSPPTVAEGTLTMEYSRSVPVVVPSRSTVPPPTSQPALRTDRSTVVEPLRPAAAPSPSLGVPRSEHTPESFARSMVSETLSPTPGSIPTAPAPTTSAPAIARYGLSASAPATLSQRFVQTPADTAARRAAEAKAVQPQVLMSFLVEQDGNRLRVVDSDGSTYVGSIEPPASEGFDAPAEAWRESPAPAMRRQFSVTQTADDAQPGLPLNQAFHFRVTGTNRTLQQPVVFAGNILMPTNVISLQQTSPAAGVAGGQPTQMQQLLPMPANSAISGRVQLGKNPEMQINAVPVSP